MRFTARHDRTGSIRFAPLGGVTFDRLVPMASKPSLPDSLLILTPEGQLLVRSKAVIHILQRMGPAWRSVGRVLAWAPHRLSDFAYDLVAHLRSRPNRCPMPNPVPDERFDP